MAESQSTWTLESLKSHFDALLTERDERLGERAVAQKDMVALALAAAEKAVMKAEAATEKRFDGVNEFRQTLADQQRNLMPRVEAEFMIGALRAEVDQLKAANLKNASQGIGRGQVVSWIVAGVMFVIAVVSFFIKLK